jgi:hypothetical protein
MTRGRLLLLLAGMAAGCLVPPAAHGQSVSALYPGGPAEPIPVTITNPTGKVMYVSGISVGVDSTGTAACPSDWFQGGSASAPGGGVAIPPRSSVTLPAKGLPAPSIRMLDSGTNQNECQNATVSFHYSSTRGHAPASSPSGSSAENARPGTGTGGALAFTGLALPVLAAAGLVLGGAGVALRGVRAGR